jgi:hypothetical protein
MPRAKLPENELPAPIARLKGLRRNSLHVKPTPKEIAEKRVKQREYSRKAYVKKAANPDGSLIPVKDRGKKKRGRPGGTPTGSTPVTSLAWFRDYLRQPLEQMLAKPRSEMSAIEAITVEAVRLAIDTRGEETVIEAIQENNERGGGKRSRVVGVKDGLRNTLGSDVAARFFSTPEDRLKAIKHLHAYQLGQAPSTVDLKNNGGSFEAGPPTPFDVEVVLTRADGSKEKLERLDRLPPHPETDEERADREATEVEEDVEQAEEDAKPFKDCDPFQS